MYRFSQWVPFPLRVEIARLRRLPSWWLEWPSIARTRVASPDDEGFAWLLARHSSPLERAAGTIPAALQQGKERNVALAARHLDRLCVRPHEIFSYHHRVGRPSRLRGFCVGLELHEGKISGGVGGGCCLISNALYLLALRAGMRIVERHRHGLDLFPDHDRKVPFGCGATVFYNYADLRFENPLPVPVLLRLQVTTDRHLISELWTTKDPDWTVEIYETGHRFYREGENWMRENHVWRRFRRPGGEILMDEEIAHNRGRVLYEPTEGIECDATD